MALCQVTLRGGGGVEAAGPPARGGMLPSVVTVIRRLNRSCPKGGGRPETKAVIDKEAAVAHISQNLGGVWSLLWLRQGSCIFLHSRILEGGLIPVMICHSHRVTSSDVDIVGSYFRQGNTQA